MWTIEMLMTKVGYKRKMSQSQAASLFYYFTVKGFNLNIIGPFSLFKKDEFDYFFNSPVIKEKGIYLWTFPYKDSELIYYIGETGRNFLLGSGLDIRQIEPQRH